MEVGKNLAVDVFPARLWPETAVGLWCCPIRCVVQVLAEEEG
jgi:hypothetical protein